MLTREEIPSRGFQSSMDYKQVIGIGKAAMVDSLLITWPDRTTKKIIHPAINQVLTIEKDDEKDTLLANSEVPVNTMFVTVPANFDKHQENNLIEFFNERNIPRMLSREGPKAAVGDVNGDGLDDVYIGGTPQHPGQLYLQQAGGSFVKKRKMILSNFWSLKMLR